MLVNMRLNHSAKLRVCLNNRRIINRNVRLNMSFMVLIWERCRRLHHHEVCILHSRCHRHRLWWRRRWWQYLLYLLNTHRFVHTLISIVHSHRTMDLRVRLDHPHHFLSKHNALAHRENVGVTDRNDIYSVIKVLLLNPRITISDHVWIGRWQVVLKKLRKEVKLNTLRIVQSLVNRAHNAATALKQRNRCPDRRFLITITYLHITN